MISLAGKTLPFLERYSAVLSSPFWKCRKQGIHYLFFPPIKTGEIPTILMFYILSCKDLTLLPPFPRHDKHVSCRKGGAEKNLHAPSSFRRHPFLSGKGPRFGAQPRLRIETMICAEPRVRSSCIFRYSLFMKIHYDLELCTMEVNYRPLLPSDTCALIEVFMRVRPRIFRLNSRLVYRALIDEILHSKNAFGLVAVNGGELAGFITAAVDWPHFKRLFILKHPLVGLSVLLQAVSRFRIGKISKSASRAASPGAAAHQRAAGAAGAAAAGEGGNKKGIAYIIQSGVDPAHRSQGIGTGLHAAMQAYLAAQGIKRIECHIDAGNTASVIMHERTHWTMLKNPTGYFGYVDLTGEQVDGKTSSGTS